MSLDVSVCSPLSQGGSDTVSSNCTDGELRLVNGSVPTEGRLEICFNHAWGTVCNENGTSDGVLMVACRTLGFFPIGKRIHGLYIVWLTTYTPSCTLYFIFIYAQTFSLTCLYCQVGKGIPHTHMASGIL